MLNQKLKIALVMGAIVALGACSKNDDGGSQIQQKITCENGQVKEVGIFGGETLSSESILSKGMVLIYRSMGAEGGAFCTGSLIDSNIVLTAAHCVPPKGEKPETVSIYWSVDPVCSVVTNGDESLVRTADKITVHPSYYTDDGADNQTRERGDMAMIRLSEPAPVDAIPARLISQSIRLKSKSKILVAGFGKTTDYASEDSEKRLMRFALVKPFQLESSSEASSSAVSSTVSSTTSSDSKKKSGSEASRSSQSSVVNSKITNDLSREGLYFDQRDGQGACAGDSGGPSMIKGVDGQWSIIGVASFVDPLSEAEFKDKKVTCRRGVAYSSVVYFKEWIKKTYDALKNSQTTNGLKWAP